MSVTIRILGVAGPVTHPDTIARVGDYVKEFDPDAHDGRGKLVTTPNQSDAKRFDGFIEAWGFWQKQSSVVPLRADGKPNRPLTCFTVTIE